MRSTFGNNIKLTLFGGSHDAYVGASVENIPSGIEIDANGLSAFMDRRRGGMPLTTPRREDDIPRFTSGIDGMTTNGGELTVIIDNRNVRSGDYNGFANTPRPSHADYTALKRYGADCDIRGGGHFSGRLTAPLCAVGYICKSALAKNNIRIGAHLESVGSVCDTRFNPVSVCAEDFDAVVKSGFPTIDKRAGERMKAEITDAANDGDSVGAVIECAVIGLEAGYGSPLFDGIENRLSAALFSLGGVRGVEFGTGFAASRMRGSEHNDAFCVSGGEVATKTNNCGGVLGGISDGMPIIFRVAFKPTASISKKQMTVDLTDMCETELEIQGRHDPCIGLRALPCVEAICAFTLLDILNDER